MANWIADIVQTGYALINTTQPQDILDILMVSIVVYGLIVVVRDTNTSQVVRGILLLFVASIFASELELRAFGYLLQAVLDFGVIALFVLFAPEIRRGLDQMGRARFLGNNLFSRRSLDEGMQDEWRKTISAVSDAVQQLSDKHTGALIVLERSSHLFDYSRNATKVNADVTTELLCNIFFNGSPLHDGAVIISDARLLSAGCVLPLSGNIELSKDLGTRHRAALGIAEMTDAIAVVVSEESGTVSMAKNGVLIRRLNRSSLYSMLEEELVPKKKDDNGVKLKDTIVKIFKSKKTDAEDGSKEEDEKA